jgi:hypothetical protein
MKDYGASRAAPFRMAIINTPGTNYLFHEV